MKNDRLLFFYYRNPSGEYSIKEELPSYIVNKYQISTKIPIASNLEWIPRNGIVSSDKYVQFTTLNSDGISKILEDYYSDENLSKANEEDKKFLQYFGLKFKTIGDSGE